ncbi:MAG TPA: DUF2461 domain-containing protein [Rhizomicrobium sp.]|nr:DUF2461 domain-containing protein [Rhizomicrobium sp.]
MADGFPGFPKDFFVFFRELKAHNERAWFEDNKQRYRTSVQAPMSAFIEAMAPKVKTISKHFVCDPKPNGGSMFRIHRDVRFAKDKRPYKENAGCFFRHEAGRDAAAPGFYMHFAPDEVFFGGGCYMPEPASLAKIRQAIVDRSAAWKKIGEVRGAGLSRPPRGFAPGHPLIEDIKRKSFYAARNSTVAVAVSPKLVGEATEAFKSAAPLMRFLCNALDVPF